MMEIMSNGHRYNIWLWEKPSKSSSFALFHLCPGEKSVKQISYSTKFWGKGLSQMPNSGTIIKEMSEFRMNVRHLW